MSKNPKKTRWRSMKIANIDREILHIFWMNWGISMKFLGKMWLMIILKVTKKQGFILFRGCNFSKNCSASVLIIKHFMVWKVVYCFLKTLQDFFCPNIVTEIMKEAVVRNSGLCKLWQKLCFWALEHVFNGSIGKSFRKKLLLHQMRYHFLCKVSTCSPATHQCLHLLLLLCK